MDRRDFLIKTALAAGAGLACRDRGSETGEPLAAATAPSSGRVREVVLSAEPMDVDLGTANRFKVFGYNGTMPGPEIRVQEGETLRARLVNRLPEPTTIHWHGVPVPNGMDGVPGVTQAPVEPGESFTYEFAAWPAGTYIYHSHFGYQLDQGLHGVLVVEPARQPGHDREFVLSLEDWATVDGGGPAASRAGRVDPGGMGGMMGGRMMGGNDGPAPAALARGRRLRQPIYDAYVINGQTGDSAEPLRVRKGDRVRLRIVNPSASTTFLLRLAGHRLRVTHADGRPVQPVVIDVLRIGMGERCDAEFIADNPGRWALMGAPDGAHEARPLRVVLYDGITAKELSTESRGRRILAYSDLTALPEEGLPPIERRADRTFHMRLSGGMMGSPYWTINGERYPDTDTLDIARGERVRLEYFNMSMMPHPMHLHGHFFEIDLPGRPRKDTVLISPMMGQMAVEFIADNPGAWFHHCHNLYHMEAGMANVVRVRKEG